MENLQEKDQVNILDEYNLTINPQGFKGDYGCMITIDDGKSIHSLRYRLIIQYTGALNKYVKYYKIDRSKAVYSNDKEPESFIDRLALQVSSILYPLEIQVDYKGTLVDIINFEEIKERWSLEKEKIKGQYTGTIVNDYIRLTDHTLRSSDVLLEKMKKDWFLNLYFAPLYIDYTEEYYVDQQITYPTAGKVAPIKYQVTQKLEGAEDIDARDYRIKINGAIDDERCALDIEQGLDTPYYNLLNPQEKDLKGTCELTYLLNKEIGIIEGFEANFVTQYAVPKKVEVLMFLQERLEIEKKEETKKGFWAKLFNI